MNRSRKLLVLLCLVVLGLSYFYAAVYFQFSSSSSMGIIQPDIVLEQGTSGNSTVYSNGTSASVSVDSYSTTFFPNDYNVDFGDYVSGSTPVTVSAIDENLFTVNATGSRTANQVYYPSSMTLLNSTTNVFDWGINTTSFTDVSVHTSYRYMGGTSPDIANMKITKLHIRANGAGVVAIGLYTGGNLTDPTGATKQTEAYNVAVVAGWNEIDVPDYMWPQNTTTWIGWAHNTGVYYSDQSSDAEDFQTATGRWNQDIPADADETTAMPSNPTAGSFDAYWYAVYAEYEVGSLGNLTANDGVNMRLSSSLTLKTLLIGTRVMWMVALIRASTLTLRYRKLDRIRSLIPSVKSTLAQYPMITSTIISQM